jgi:hypothetical protein
MIHVKDFYTTYEVTEVLGYTDRTLHTYRHL